MLPCQVIMLEVVWRLDNIPRYISSSNRLGTIVDRTNKYNYIKIFFNSRKRLAKSAKLSFIIFKMGVLMLPSLAIIAMEIAQRFANHVRYLPQTTAPRQHCIGSGCENWAQESKIYCSLDCIIRHANESMEIISKEKSKTLGLQQEVVY